MQDDQEEEIIPQNSKCWNCMHGMVLQDKELQSFFQPGVVEGDAFESKPDQPGMTEVSFPVKKIRSVCFWRSNMSGNTISPLVFSLVEECSRYESN